MSWLFYNIDGLSLPCFHLNLSWKLVLTADALVSSGLAELGYVYVNIGTLLACPKCRVFLMFCFILELIIFQPMQMIAGPLKREIQRLYRFYSVQEP